MSDTADAFVLGAGVIGLTTAICLQELGLRVRIRSADPPARSTSVLAAAMVGPNLAPPDDPLHRWQSETVRRLATEPDGAGVHVLSGVLAARPAGMEPPQAKDVPGYRPCLPGELPDGFGTGFRATLPVVDMPRYLDHLRDRFSSGGGVIELRPVASLAEAAAAAPLVANCTGLAARTLVPDPQVHPLRGPKIVVANPGIETFFIEAPFSPVWAGYLPHGDRVVLGGSQRPSADTTPDPAEEAEILRLCAEVEPRLAGAQVLEHRVGLRPGRELPRVEPETRNGVRVVHNYGHGGSGVMLSWGCARDAAAMLAR
jgi:D-amino-acid oxidase